MRCSAASLRRVRAIAPIACAALLCITVSGQQSSPWVATWGTALVQGSQANAPELTGETLRLIVHTSAGGSQARIWLSNRFGVTPLRIGAANIAISQESSAVAGADLTAIAPESGRALTFAGSAEVIIPPGATIVSDPVALNAPPLANLAVSLYFPENTLGLTLHTSARQSSYITTGNAVAASTFTSLTPNREFWSRDSWYFLSGVDVYAPGTSAIVALGDSITDGNHSTLNANHRWPDYLAARLAASSAMRKAGVLGVVNAGISGNRVLLDGDGPSALSRMDWDVLDRSGARYLILFHGINDIEAATRNRQPYGDLLKRLQWGLAQIAAQAHQHGMRVIAATQMPDCHSDPCTWPEGEKVRSAFNEWIRHAKIFDGLIDFDEVTRDPAHLTELRAEYNSGDFVHPNDAGYKAMADAIDLTLFTHTPAQPQPAK